MVVGSGRAVSGVPAGDDDGEAKVTNENLWGPAGPVLPDQTRDDTDRGWGQDAAADDDEWLLRERPPHWE
jgi:hypothetical protein